MEIKQMIKLDSSIIQATVYSSKALVVRKGTMKIKPKKTALTISNLPLSLDPSSIRVKGLSLTGTMIEGIDIEKLSHKVQIKPVQELLDKLEDLKRELELINNEINFIDNRLGNNKSLEEKFAHDFSRYYSRGKVSLDQFSSLRNQLKDEYTELSNQKIALNKQIKKLKREIEILEFDIENKNISQKPDDYSLSVFLHNPSDDKSDDFQLEFSYIVSGANWKPMYDFRADTKKGEIIVDYFGMVTQNTGEDWNNVELILSTASPSIITTIPKIHPWYLDKYAPQLQPKERPAAKLRMSRTMKEMGAPPSAPTAGAFMDIEDGEVAPEPQEAKSLSAMIEDTGEAQIFAIPKKETISSERKPHQVLIAQITNPLETDFLAIPTITSDIIHRGKMTNKSNLIFLSGEIRLFEGNEFIGKTWIEKIAPTEKFTLALGTTSKIKVKRKISSQQVEKKGMIAKTRVRSMEVTIEAVNNRTEKTALVIKDRIPTSKHEDIKVKIVNLSPTPMKKTKLNICIWNLLLDPEKKLKITQVYEIENPIDLTILGI